MDFGIKIITTINGVNITQTMMNTWIIIILLIIISLIIRVKLNKFTDVPTTKFQNITESIISTMDNFVSQTMGKEYRYFGSWFFTIFCFILLSNYAGLFSFRSPTADLGTTFALSLSTFALIHFMGIKVNKGNYFKGYLEPHPIILPLNLIGEIATPVSLALRLFGNILGGTIIMGLVNYSLSSFNALIQIVGFGFITPILHSYFDVFAGFLQTFIFVILSMTFIKGKIGD